MSNQDDSSRESLSNLTAEELRTLVDLTRHLVRSDTEITDAERHAVSSIAERAGADEFWKRMDASAESEDDLEAIFVRAQSLTVVAAQELIYGTLYEVSMVDGTDGKENEILEKLATIWKLTIEDLEE